MHDTHLMDKIHTAILDLCRANAIVRLTKINIEVGTDSHMNEDNLRDFLIGRDKMLVGPWTDIVIERKEMGRLTAFIRTIDGDAME